MVAKINTLKLRKALSEIASAKLIQAPNVTQSLGFGFFKGSTIFLHRILLHLAHRMLWGLIWVI